MEAKAKCLKPAAMKYLEKFISQKSECDNKYILKKSPVMILERMEANGGKISV